MGQGTSSLPSSLPQFALHCLRVAPSSPAAGQLEPFFDYLVGVDTELPGDAPTASNEGLSPLDLGRVLEANEGKRISLKVYNAKSQRIRDVLVVPSRTWVEEAMRANGEAPDPEAQAEAERKPSLLGLSLRVCNPARALESVYHVLDVLEGSPAEMAGKSKLSVGFWHADKVDVLTGLVPYGDFVIAWSGGPLHSENDFYSLVESHVDKALRLFVYNSDLEYVLFFLRDQDQQKAMLTSSNLREVVLYPTKQWGGEGLIGCGIGYGLLHRIPRPATPPATVFSADGYFSPDVNTVSERQSTDSNSLPPINGENGETASSHAQPSTPPPPATRA